MSENGNKNNKPHIWKEGPVGGGYWGEIQSWRDDNGNLKHPCIRLSRKLNNGSYENVTIYIGGFSGVISLIEEAIGIKDAYFSSVSVSPDTYNVPSEFVGKQNVGSSVSSYDVPSGAIDEIG